MKKSLIVFLFIVALQYSAFGQDIAQTKIVWKAIQVTEGQSTSKPMVCDFVTNGLQSVSWIQKQGALNTTFNVSSTEGAWADVKSSGSFIYVLENGGRVCIMKLERNPSGVFIVLDFIKDGVSASKLQFRIETIE